MEIGGQDRMLAPVQRILHTASAWVGAAGLLLVALAVAGAALADAPRPFGQGRLWQVSPAGAAPSYVFGTMHVADEDVVSVPEAVTAAIVRSDRLVLEVAMTRKNAMYMARAMVFEDGRRLSDVVGPKRFAAVGRVAGRYGITAAQIAMFRPWAVITMFSVPPAELKRQAAGHAVLDRLLNDQAVRRGMPVFDLEDIEEQLAILRDLPERDQVEMLDWTLQLNAQIDEIFEKIKRAYLDGDLDRLHAMTRELSAGTDLRLMEVFNRRLVETRNELMVKRMERHLKRGRAFVAVGALHLSGEQGILRLLEKKGYAVRRIM
jgi:uncharacterized protein YbaP (TraB family)